jgi:hypothetical protein
MILGIQTNFIFAVFLSVPAIYSLCFAMPLLSNSYGFKAYDPKLPWSIFTFTVLPTPYP